jgi:hypothetical protein
LAADGAPELNSLSDLRVAPASRGSADLEVRPATWRTDLASGQDGLPWARRSEQVVAFVRTGVRTQTWTSAPHLTWGFAQVRGKEIESRPGYLADRSGQRSAVRMAFRRRAGVNKVVAFVRTGVRTQTWTSAPLLTWGFAQVKGKGNRIKALLLGGPIWPAVSGQDGLPAARRSEQVVAFVRTGVRTQTWTSAPLLTWGFAQVRGKGNRIEALLPGGPIWPAVSGQDGLPAARRSEQVVAFVRTGVRTQTWTSALLLTWGFAQVRGKEIESRPCYLADRSGQRSAVRMAFRRRAGVNW